MARRHTSVLASIGMLSIGLAIGGHLESMRLTQSARAVNEEGNYETRVPANAAALVESGNHISDIADAVMPSAVHIQAIRVEAERKVRDRFRSTDAKQVCSRIVRDYQQPRHP